MFRWCSEAPRDPKAALGHYRCGLPCKRMHSLIVKTQKQSNKLFNKIHQSYFLVCLDNVFLGLIILSYSMNHQVLYYWAKRAHSWNVCAYNLQSLNKKSSLWAKEGVVVSSQDIIDWKLVWGSGSLSYPHTDCLVTFPKLGVLMQLLLITLFHS